MGNYSIMKSIIALSVVGAASAFVTPGQSSSTKLFAANPSLDMEAAEVEEPKKVYPTVNGWTADPDKFCAGLPGAVAPLGEFDPLGFTKGLPVQEIKRFREAEITHGRVAMLATVGYLVAEPFHPFFNGDIIGPANTHLTQVQEVAPFLRVVGYVDSDGGNRPSVGRMGKAFRRQGKELGSRERRGFRGKNVAHKA